MKKVYILLIILVGCSKVFAFSQSETCDLRAKFVASFALARDQGKSQKEMEKEVRREMKKKFGMTYEKTSMKDYMDVVYLKPNMSPDYFYKFANERCLAEK